MSFVVLCTTVRVSRRRNYNVRQCWMPCRGRLRANLALGATVTIHPALWVRYENRCARYCETGLVVHRQTARPCFENSSRCLQRSFVESRSQNFPNALSVAEISEIRRPSVLLSLAASFRGFLPDCRFVKETPGVIPLFDSDGSESFNVRVDTTQNAQWVSPYQEVSLEHSVVSPIVLRMNSRGTV